MKEFKVINQSEVLGKKLNIYGDFENPLILAKDVAEWIEYSKSGNGSYNISQMVSSIDEDEKLTSTMLVAGQNRQVIFLTENGLYEVLMQSRKPIAKEFKREVKKVLKTVRKTYKALDCIEFKGNINGLVYSKDGMPITTSRIIAQITNKEHFHIIRDIKEEINKLNKLNQFHSPNLDDDNSYSYQMIINDFKETTYLAENGQTYTEYELGEIATMQLLLKYSTEYRAKFILAFQKMRNTLMNMFKVKVIESVLPQDNRLRQYIYVIKNPLNETVKIGVAHDVDKRIKQLETGTGIQLELIYKSMICSNAFSIEKDVHEHFEEYRTFGEWFKVNPQIVINFLEQQSFILKSEFLKTLSLNSTYSVEATA